MSKILELSEENIFKNDALNEIVANVESNGTIPYIEKNKVLMAPGVWNDCYYSKESIIKAVENTDWEDRYNSNLVLDHKDNDFGEWVGEVKNRRFDKETGYLYGDLYVYDPVTAVKLKYGKPKTGISPKVTGDVEEKAMTDFVFNNFSIVINPAVKKAFINNSEGNRPVFYSEGGVEMSEEDVKNKTEGNEAEANTKKNGAELSEVEQFNKFADGFIKENAEASLSDIYSAYVKENSEDEDKSEESDKDKEEKNDVPQDDSEVSENAEEDKDKDKEDEEDIDEEKDKEMSDLKNEVKTMSETISKLNDKIKNLEEPVKATRSGVVAEMSTKQDSDAQMLGFLQGI